MNTFSLLERIANILIINSPIVQSIGLLNGKTGAAICLYNLYKTTGNKIYEKVVDNLIDLIYEEIHSRTLLSFSSGLSGVGCGIEYLVRENFVEVADIDEALEEIDEAIFQLDRSKYKPLKNYSDFYGSGLYYLIRTKNGEKRWSKKAVKFFTCDLKSIISDTIHEQDEAAKENEISNNFLVSLIGFISETKQLFPQKLVERVRDFVKEKLNLEKLNITEKIVLSNFIEITDNKFNVIEEVEKLNDMELLKACSDFTCYNMFFPKVVAELKLLLQNKLDSVIETESMQKQLFDTNLELTGLYPLISQTNYDKKTERALRQVPTKNPNSINLYIFNETSRAAICGIGTYMNELVYALKNTEELHLNIVKLNDETKEFTIVIDEETTYWKIPGSKYHNKMLNEM
jgi:hypothetical protein